MKDNLLHFANVPEAQELAQLQTQMQRPGRNVNADGGFELGWGTALLCFGLSSYFVAALPKFVFMSSWTSWVTFVPLACAAFAPYAVPKAIKRFITWPRTGYVANTYDLKFTYLLTLMVFGLALGSCLSMPFVIFFKIVGIYSWPGPRFEWHTIVLDGLKLLISAILAVYLGRKVIRKPTPMPSAYDAAAIMQAVKQTPGGRKRLSLFWVVMWGFFLGAPLVAGAVVFGLMYLNKSALRPPTIHWSELGMPSFLVGANAMLYFMGSGVVLKTHMWKWLVLATMLVGPVLVAPLIPSPAAQPGTIPILQSMPPVMLVLGLTWFLSGLVTLILFIRNNPFPATETP